jgi:hypothetical protein
MLDPHLIAAEWYLGGLNSETLPEFALKAIEEGHSGKNLAQLAAMVKPTKRDLDGLIDGAFRELAVPAPLSKDEAALRILGSVKGNAGSAGITSLTLIGKLLAAMPELEKQYIETLKEYHGLAGNYFVFAVILRPAIKKEIATGGSTDFIRRSSSFFEQVCISGDSESINVLWIEMFEWLVHSRAGELKFLWPALGPSTKAVIKEVALRRREIENLP